MMTLRELMATFPTEDACKDFLAKRRWPDRISCPRCGKPDAVYELKTRPWHWECANKDCRSGNAYRFSIISGTIFENTKYPLKVWFEVLWSMLNAKKGISAMQVQRQIGCASYQTAWYMCHRLRAAMNDPDFKKLMGIVEVDETYIGGKDKNRHRSKKSRVVRDASGFRRPGKTIGFKKVGVVGAIARKGSVVARVIGDADARTLQDFVANMVDEKVSLVATDEHPAYRYIGLPHEAVNHSAGEYVRGEVHTASIESFWSLLKRGVVGTYHNVSKKYLPLYLAEFQFRHNNRKNPEMFGLAIAGC